MTGKEASSTVPFVDPEEAPELDQDWFDGADVHDGRRLVRRGRPPSENPKRSIHLRLSAEVLDYFRSTGPGWQTRIDEALLRIARRARKAA